PASTVPAGGVPVVQPAASAASTAAAATPRAHRPLTAPPFACPACVSGPAPLARAGGGADPSARRGRSVRAAEADDFRRRRRSVRAGATGRRRTDGGHMSFQAYLDT